MTDRIWIAIIVVLAIALVFSLRDDDERDREGRERAARKLIVEIDHDELCHRERFGRYTGRLTDLAAVSSGGYQVRGAADGLRIALEASRDGRGYVKRVTGGDVDYVIERRGREVIAAASGSREPRLKPRCASRR